MRLHHLEVTAFGPFASTAEVDFDELSAGGVFLLTGATGAGKTSVLDAVCFALYGQVPGDRAGARHLRSDHAAKSVAPRVVLRVSIGERTFRFTRSPAWSRPKQRGSGETRVQAHVLVEELVGGRWTALTNRLDDAGLLVTDLLGMTAAQFTQVALLPQGRFQAFLRASSTERHAVLQKLFRTDRFEQVERWLVDQRSAARRASEASQQRVHDVLNRLQEVAAEPVPATWAEDLAAAADRGEVTEWSAGILHRAGERCAATAALRASADRTLAESDAALADARRVHELRTRAEAAARQLVDLGKRADELTHLRGRLTAHRRAAPLAALVDRAQGCRRRADSAAAQWAARRSGVAATAGLEAPTRERLAELHHQAVAGLAVAEAFRPRAADLTSSSERLTGLRRRLTELADALETIDGAIAEHPAAVGTARAALTEAQAAVVAVPLAEQEVTRLSALAQASTRLTAVTAELTTARADLAAATDAAQAARDHYLDVREARINGMAAELAGALAVGCACPVCGSASHPAPASGGGSVGRAEEETARRTHEDAAFAQQGQEVRVATLEAEREGLAARLGAEDRATLDKRLGTARDALHAHRLLAGECGQRAEQVRVLEVEAEAAGAARDRTATALSDVKEEVQVTAAQVASATDELRSLLAGAAPDLESLIAMRADECVRIDRAVKAFSAYDEAERAAADADRAVAAAAREAGFPDPSAAVDALLAPHEAEATEAELAAAAASRMAAEQVLADPVTRSATTQPAPDLDVAVVKQRLAADNSRAATSVHDAASARSERLVALGSQLRRQLDTWTPLREHHAVVAELAQLVEGKGPDNPLRIRLAAYVLSERLRQVVAAANERLARMTGQRYALEHTDDRGAGEQRGGLSLLVRDDWNGVPRDPATLSGGETFVVSLALALGLADTVAHESGGTDIDTLFIDEGFGSLDPETLEDVMDTLDTLRDGGRVVGLVSHVPELRSRITTQLEVLKGRHGSTLRVVLAGG